MLELRAIAPGLNTGLNTGQCAGQCAALSAALSAGSRFFAKPLSIITPQLHDGLL